MALKIEGLKKKYMLKEALSGVDLKLECGKMVGLLGPNGSGKTTLMRIASGLLKPSSGRLVFEETEQKKGSRERVAYMPTESHLYDWMTVEETLAFFKKFFPDFDEAKARASIQSVKLEPRQKIKSLSSGQRARLKLALTLARETTLYLIDEPLNGVDPISRDMILQMLAESVREDRCIVISSHLITEFEPILDDVVFLKNGAVELMGDAETLRSNRNMSIHELYKEVYQNA